MTAITQPQVALSVSVAALLVSVVVASVQVARWLRDRKNLKAATITCRLEHRSTSESRRPNDVVVLENIGPAPANDVMVALMLDAEAPQLLGTLPVPVLAPHGEYALLLVTHYGQQPQMPIRVSWSDDLGQHSYDSTLSIL